jgi:hypothetical protein
MPIDKLQCLISHSFFSDESNKCEVTDQSWAFSVISSRINVRWWTFTGFLGNRASPVDETCENDLSIDDTLSSNSGFSPINWPNETMLNNSKGL